MQKSFRLDLATKWFFDGLFDRTMDYLDYLIACLVDWWMDGLLLILILFDLYNWSSFLHSTRGLPALFCPHTTQCMTDWMLLSPFFTIPHKSKYSCTPCLLLMAWIRPKSHLFFSPGIVQIAQWPSESRAFGFGQSDSGKTWEDLRWLRYAGVVRESGGMSFIETCMRSLWQWWRASSPLTVGTMHPKLRKSHSLWWRNVTLTNEMLWRVKTVP